MRQANIWRILSTLVAAAVFAPRDPAGLRSSGVLPITVESATIPSEPMNHATPPREPRAERIELDEFVPCDDAGRPLGSKPAPHVPQLFGPRRLEIRPYGGSDESLIVVTMLIVVGVYLIGSFFSQWMPVIRAIK